MERSGGRWKCPHQIVVDFQCATRYSLFELWIQDADRSDARPFAGVVRSNSVSKVMATTLIQLFDVILGSDINEKRIRLAAECQFVQAWLASQLRQRSTFDGLK